MANLKEVKNRIQSVTSTQQITKAMKMVAAAKLRRAQDNVTNMRPYAAKLSEVLLNLSSADMESETAKFSKERPVNNVLLIVITSDKGLCGAFNSNVFKATSRHIEEHYASQHAAGNVKIMPIGRKALEHYNRLNFPIVDTFWEMFTPVTFEKAADAAQFAMDNFLNGTYDKVDLIYNEFKNVATQILRTESYLPVLPKEDKEGALEVDYIYQPSREEIVVDLIPRSLKVQVYKGILDSNAAEHGARMTAMDQATENAGELLKELRLTYNRTRQAAITKEILEIVAGAEALGG
jgi:F-type H+-transporting ATPase subunit gamma